MPYCVQQIPARGHVSDPNSLSGRKKFHGVFSDDFAGPDGMDAVGRQLETGTLPHRLGDAKRGARRRIALARMVHFDEIDVMVATEQSRCLGHKMNHHRDTG